MAYFPHAYRKVFIARDVDVQGGVTSDALGTGQVSVLDKTFTSVAPGAIAANGLYTLAQGSLHSVDKIGPHHGGYQESVKSKGINPKFISKVWTKDAAAPVAGSATIASAAGTFPAGKTIFLRVDVKGSPALRFLGRNSYFVADYLTDCDDAQTPVDASKVLLGLAASIAGDPLVSPFVSATVEEETAPGVWTPITVATSNGNVCRLVLEGAYVDTRFGDCSFRPTDFFEKEPVQILLSELNESGDICVNDFEDAVISPAVQGSGFGESVIREFILSNRYMQEPYNNDPRIREITDAIAFEVDRTASYKEFNLLHSIPRSYNPSGMHNSDQYLLTVYAPAGSGQAADMDSYWAALAAAADLVVEAY